MPPELKIGLETGARIPISQKTVATVGELLALRALRQAHNSKVIFPDIPPLFRGLTGVDLPENITDQLGFNRLPNWRLLHAPSALSLIISGTDTKAGSDFDIDNALATIVFLRGTTPAYRPKRAGFKQVYLEEVRMAGITESQRLIELSYANKDDESTPTTQPALELSHIGFSVSPNEFPEKGDTVNTYHSQNSIISRFPPNEAHRPFFTSSPLEPTEVDRNFTSNLNSMFDYIGPSLITPEMMREVDPTDERVIRSEYSSHWGTIAKNDPSFIIFLGQEGISERAGFITDPKKDTLTFGLSLDTRKLKKPKDLKPWTIKVPTNLKSTPANPTTDPE